jgi:hypothetical protein
LVLTIKNLYSILAVYPCENVPLSNSNFICLVEDQCNLHFVSYAC